MTLEEENIAFVRKHYAGSIVQDGNRFYYENADMPPAQFYFNTWEEAAADLAIEIGVTDEERASLTGTILPHVAARQRGERDAQSATHEGNPYDYTTHPKEHGAWADGYLRHIGG